MLVKSAKLDTNKSTRQHTCINMLLVRARYNVIRSFLSVVLQMIHNTCHGLWIIYQYKNKMLIFWSCPSLQQGRPFPCWPSPRCPCLIWGLQSTPLSNSQFVAPPISNVLGTTRHKKMYKNISSRMHILGSAMYFFKSSGSNWMLCHEYSNSYLWPKSVIEQRRLRLWFYCSYAEWTNVWQLGYWLHGAQFVNWIIMT